MILSDTEKIILLSGDSEEDCECVTSADVELWNSTYETVSSNSANWDSASLWSDSADYWNSTYETVSSNSANWDSAYAIASNIDVDTYDEVASIVSASKDFLTTYSGQSAILLDSAYFSGIGTSGDEITLSDDLKSFNTLINTVFQQLYSDGQVGESAYKTWLDQSALDNVYDYINKFSGYFWSVNNDFPEDGEITDISTDGIFHQLTKIWYLLRSVSASLNSVSAWIYVEDLSVSNASSYSDEGIFYYN